MNAINVTKIKNLTNHKTNDIISFKSQRFKLAVTKSANYKTPQKEKGEKGNLKLTSMKNRISKMKNIVKIATKLSKAISYRDNVLGHNNN